MLKGIPKILSPELLKVLCEMGHGDELTIGDGNFPGHTNAKIEIRMDGHNVPEILEAILKVMPLDTYVDAPVALMATTQGDPRPVIWDEYREIVMKHQKNVKPELVERFAFYERAKQAYAIIATGETALYANIILKKVVVTE